MHRGYVKTYRKILEWEWYKDIPVRVLFEHCILKANIKDKNWKGIVIKRGSFVTSLDNLVFETGLTKRQIRTALDKLKMTHELTYNPTRQYSVIIVNNYEQYQPSDTQIDTQMTDKRHTNDTQITLTKEIKNDKNDKNIISLAEKTEKKLDPFINPVKTFFQEEYSKIMGKTPRLSLFECNRLVELAAENPDIKEVIPLAIKKLKKLNFGKDIKFTPSANWLLKDNNFERILNGEFDRANEPEKMEVDGWNL
ncbi:MAG: hypothetical protein J6S67_20915 [Methanobrevibacter sp.]|nr:hypothetical protein [Methanobrevibacter sp.]